MRAGAVVRPDERRVHERATPTLGASPCTRGSLEALGVMLAATIIFVVALVNDLREVSGPAKVAGGSCRCSGSL